MQGSFDLHEVFKCAHFKFMVISKYTHMHVQCMTTNVGIAQAHPNYIFLLASLCLNNVSASGRGSYILCGCIVSTQSTYEPCP